MSATKQVAARAVSTAKVVAPLRTKYFCQVNNKETVEVLMELFARNVSTNRRLPLRYVLVIDVSGSMEFPVGSNGGNETLIDRVKIFAELVVQNVRNDDSIAIVTFADDVQVDMFMTLMDNGAKKKAKKVVKNLAIRGGTNIEVGIMKAIEVLKSSNSSADTRDMVLMFTDGEANQGVINPEELVNMYKDAQSSLKKITCVPLAAFTIGHYVPYLLNELAKYLGSDSFYWLDEEEQFEADMLIPVFLREATQVTDVSIVAKCQKNVTFSEEEIYETNFLQERSESKLTYFIHAMPDASRKHISFTLQLPQNELEKLNDQRIIDIKISYLNGKLTGKKIDDFVILCVTTLSESKKLAQVVVNPTASQENEELSRVSAFTMTKNQVKTAWDDAQDSLVAIATDKCRKHSMAGMHNLMANYMSDQDSKTRDEGIGTTISSIIDVKKTYASLLGDRGKHSKQLTNTADTWISRVNYGSKTTNENNLGRLFATLSSIETEMPTAKGIFDPETKQPFIPDYLEKKLREFEKIVKRTKRDQTAFQTTSVFKAQNILLSESLRDQKVGEKKQETIQEMIIRCGGRPVPNVNTVYNNTMLVCSSKDYRRDSMLVRDSKRAKIPIVHEKFIFDCIQEKRILDIEEYRIESGVGV